MGFLGRTTKYIKCFGFSGSTLDVAVWSRKSKKEKLKRLAAKKYRGPIYFRNATSDRSVMEQVLVKGEYNINFKPGPKTILDGGANIGLTSVFWASKYPDANIVAVEPEDSNFELLIKNTAPYENIVPIKAGIWHKDTYLKIEDSAADKWGFVVTETTEDTPGALKAVTVSGIIDEYFGGWVDILKLDIETSEKEVFANGSEQWLPKVGTIVIELHDRIKPGCSNAVFTALSTYDYELNLKGENIIIELHHK